MIIKYVYIQTEETFSLRNQYLSKQEQMYVNIRNPQIHCVLQYNNQLVKSCLNCATTT